MEGLATFSSLEEADTTLGGRDDEEAYSNVKAEGFGSSSSFELLTINFSGTGLDDGRDGFDAVITNGSFSFNAATLSSSD